VGDSEFRGNVLGDRVPWKCSGRWRIPWKCIGRW
jgi:hypothetical protein